MKKVAIHQPNFIPWFPFFYKMAMADVFVLLEHAQFEKNGYQNRFKYKNKWITKPVESGVQRIIDKHYTDGSALTEINFEWIIAIKNTLGIKTRIGYDYATQKTGTNRLVEIVEKHEGTVYITNPEAKLKYLDENKMRNNNIAIEYCQVPKNLQRSIFEIIEEFGIEGTIKQLPKKEAANEVVSVG